MKKPARPETVKKRTVMLWIHGSKSFREQIERSAGHLGLTRSDFVLAALRWYCRRAAHEAKLAAAREE